MALSSERKGEICRLVCVELEKASKGGFPAMKFFGMIRFRRPGPLGLRRQAWIGHLLESTGISEAEIHTFREAMSPEMKARIAEAGKVWQAKMNAFWQRRSEELKAETAAIRASREAETVAE